MQIVLTFPFIYQLSRHTTNSVVCPATTSGIAIESNIDTGKTILPAYIKDKGDVINNSEIQQTQFYNGFTKFKTCPPPRSHSGVDNMDSYQLYFPRVV